MYTTVDQTIRAALAEKGYGTLHKYVLYLHFALDGLFRVKRDNAYQSLTYIKLKVNERHAVKWPDDMIGYTRIGLPLGNRILDFIPDNSITFNQQDNLKPPYNPNNGYPLVAYDSDYDFFAFTNRYYSNGDQFLRGGGQGSYITKRFRANPDAREFQLDGGTYGITQIYLEYVSNGVKPGSETIVSMDASLALKEWIHYREARFKYGAAAGETKASEQDYLHELSQAIRSQSDLTYNGILDAISQGTRFTITQ